jgi:nickel superoxide dismutase
MFDMSLAISVELSHVCPLEEIAKHATRIQDIVTQYFMTQRIKPKQEKYAKKLTLLHRMLLAAMKCKQTTDVAHVEELRKLLKKFEKLYFVKKKE